MVERPAQFEFELSQRFDHLGFEQRCGCRVAVHAGVRETFEFVDHLVETCGVDTALAPVASQVLRFTQALANLGRELAVIAPITADRALRIEAAALTITVRLAAVLRTAGLLLTALLLALFGSLALLILLVALALFTALTLLAALRLFTTLTLLTLLTLLLPLLITLLLLLTVAVATRVLVQTSPQRIETVCQLSRAIEILFSTRTVWPTRALLRGLQTFRDVVQTAFDRAFITASRTLLTASLPSLLLSGLLITLLITTEGLLAFANTVGHTIARQRVSRIFQLSGRTLLTLTLSCAHRSRRLLEVLPQTLHRIGKRVFAFGELLARFARILILRVLTATPLEILHVFRDLALA